MAKEDFDKLTKRERRKEFFRLAQVCGLAKDDNYIDGIPNGEEEDVNNFYTLEDMLGYPKPQPIPKTYLIK